MPTEQTQEEHEFFEKRAKAIQVHINNNPAVVEAILRARQQDLKTMMPANEFFKEHGADL